MSLHDPGLHEQSLGQGGPGLWGWAWADLLWPMDMALGDGLSRLMVRRVHRPKRLARDELIYLGTVVLGFGLARWLHRPTFVVVFAAAAVLRHAFDNDRASPPAEIALAQRLLAFGARIERLVEVATVLAVRVALHRVPITLQALPSARCWCWWYGRLLYWRWCDATRWLRHSVDCWPGSASADGRLPAAPAAALHFAQLADALFPQRGHERRLRASKRPRCTRTSGGGFDEAAHRGKAETGPVHHPVPQRDGQHEQAAIRHAFVPPGHRVLRGVGDEHQQQDVGDAQRTGVAPQQEAEQQEKSPVDGAAAQHQLQRVGAELEQRQPGRHGCPRVQPG